MNPVVSAIKNLPPRETEEPAASESQLVHLRSFQIFSETTIRDLGVLQASYLIDQAKQIQEYEDEEKASAAKQKTKRGLGSIVVAVLILAAIFFGGKLYLNSLNGISSPNPESGADANAPATSSTTQIQATPEGVHPQGAANSSPSISDGNNEAHKAQIPPEFNDLTTFAGLQFPLSVRVIEPLELLDKAGKETMIPVGAIITIKERKNLGSLTMKMEGELFVGNESRLLHKVRLP